MVSASEPLAEPPKHKVAKLIDTPRTKVQAERQGVYLLTCGTGEILFFIRGRDSKVGGGIEGDLMAHNTFSVERSNSRLALKYIQLE
jgi:hypothetical protein